jgi:hypothetical protein
MNNSMDRPTGKAIGKIVKSNTHVDYVCRVYNLGEVYPLPEPSEYSFGTFVSIRLEENSSPGSASGASARAQGGELIGVIYNTLLLNPDFGNLGPRLSPRQDTEIFTPDYLSETATLVGIIAVGWIDALGVCYQGVPALAATVNSSVTRVEDDLLCEFHTAGAAGVALRYAPLLLGQNSPLASQLLLNIVDRLTLLFPAQRSRLAVMRTNLAWKSIVQPAG